MDRDYTNFLKDLAGKKKSAWKKLYDLFYPSICNYISNLIKDENAAPDLAQKIFIKLWELNIHFNSIKALTSYLYKAAKNTSINYMKAAKVERDHIEKFNLDVNHESGLDDSMILSIEEEMIRELHQSIFELPKSQREIMMLSIKGLTVKQVAEKLQISENTVKTQKKRAYASLREKLKDSIFLLMFMGL